MATILDADVAGQGVLLRMTTDAAGAASTTFRRTMRGVTQIVRGADMAPLTTGAYAVRDYEVLYNTPLTYSATVYDAAAVAIAHADVTIEVPGTSVWLRDVVVPSLSCPVRMTGKEAGDYATEMRTSMLRPLGRSNPVVVTDVRSGATGQTSFLTLSTAEFTSLDTLLATGHVLLYTGPAEWDIRWPRYVVITDTAVKRVSEALDQARLWNVSWTEVDPPPPNQYTPVNPTTWQDLQDASTHWLDIVSTPWIDVLFPVTPAVLAWSA